MYFCIFLSNLIYFSQSQIFIAQPVQFFAFGKYFFENLAFYSLFSSLDLFLDMVYLFRSFSLYCILYCTEDLFKQRSHRAQRTPKNIPIRFWVKNGRILVVFSRKISQIVRQILENFTQILMTSAYTVTERLLDFDERDRFV